VDSGKSEDYWGISINPIYLSLEQVAKLDALAQIILKALRDQPTES
jgi:hypothetical protein